MHLNLAVIEKRCRWRYQQRQNRLQMLESPESKGEQLEELSKLSCTCGGKLTVDILDWDITSRENIFDSEGRHENYY